MLQINKQKDSVLRFNIPLQKKELEEQIGWLKRQLEMTKTEYKLVDKTRIKSLQVNI